MISELNLRYPEARIEGRSGIYPGSVGSSGLRALQPRRASSKRLFVQGVMFWCSSKPISPLQCTLTKNAPVSPLESTLTKLLNLKTRGITLLQKKGGGGQRVSPPACCHECPLPGFLGSFPRVRRRTFLPPVPSQLDAPMHDTYVLQRTKDGQWYAGATQELTARVEDRLKGRAVAPIVGTAPGGNHAPFQFRRGWGI